MATNVELALAEVNAALAALAPPREGLKDYQRVGLHSDTLEFVNASVAAFDRRWDLLQGAKNALEAILNDGYPEIPVKEIHASAYEDLRDNKNTIEAAFAVFSEATAVALGLTSGVPEPRDYSLDTGRPKGQS